MFLLKGVFKLAARPTLVPKTNGLENTNVLRTFYPALDKAFTTSTTTNSAITDDIDKLYRLVEVEVRGNDPAVLKSYSWFATTAASELNIKIGKCWAHRKANHKRMTLLKSVHIYKKHRVQYEIRTYFRFMQFIHLTGSTADTFLEYIERNLPEGVALKVTKIAIESLPEHFHIPVQKTLPSSEHVGVELLVNTHQQA